MVLVMQLICVYSVVQWVFAYRYHTSKSQLSIPPSIHCKFMRFSSKQLKLGGFVQIPLL